MYFCGRLTNKKAQKMTFRKTLVTMFAALCVCTSAKAQLTLDDILGAVDGIINQGAQNDGTTSRIASVFSEKKVATADRLIGTWTYQEPAIVFTSGSLVGKAAAKLAAGRVENMIESYLADVGIKEGALVITFNSDSTFTETLNGHTTTGRWTMDEQQRLQITIEGVEGVVSLPITTQLSGNELKIVTDTTKLLQMFKAFTRTTTDSNVKAAAKLLKNFDGMYAGFELKAKT